MTYWFYNKQTKNLYKILRFEGGKVYMKSEETGQEFDVEYKKELFQKWGYELINEAQKAALTGDK